MELCRGGGFLDWLDWCASWQAGTRVVVSQPGIFFNAMRTWGVFEEQKQKHPSKHPDFTNNNLTTTCLHYHHCGATNIYSYALPTNNGYTNQPTSNTNNHTNIIHHNTLDANKHNPSQYNNTNSNNSNQSAVGFRSSRFEVQFEVQSARSHAGSAQLALVGSEASFCPRPSAQSDVEHVALEPWSCP